MTKMISMRAMLAVGSGVLAVLMLAATAPAASAAPAWKIFSRANTTAAPGGQIQYEILLHNVGTTDTGGSYEVEVTLPPGLSGAAAGPYSMSGPLGPIPFSNFDCLGSSDPFDPGDTQFSCVNSDSIPVGPNSPPEPFQRLSVLANVAPGASGPLTASFEVSGGGAAEPVSIVDPTLITTDAPEFGIDAFDGSVSGEDGEPFRQAGGHPYSISTQIDLNSFAHPIKGQIWPVEPVKNIIVDVPPGLVGNANVIAQCTAAQLAPPVDAIPRCSTGSQVGIVRVRFDASLPIAGTAPLYNVVPPTGTPARFAFNFANVVVALDAELRSDGDYGLSVATRSISQALPITGNEVVFWGDPTNAVHDPQRFCPGEGTFGCDAERQEVAFLRMPTSCQEIDASLRSTVRADSWVDPGDFDSRSFLAHEPPGYPADPNDPTTPWGGPLAATGCDDLPFEPAITLQPGTQVAEAPTGLSVRVEMPNPGLENPEGTAAADIKKATVTLPEGMTINPSAAEGLGVCTPAQYAKEKIDTEFGQGCPADSKVGSVRIDTQLLDEPVEGDLFMAQQDDPSTTTPGAENPFDSLLATYVVAKNFERGILVKLAGKVEPDANTGRIVTTFDDLPQLPFEKFTLRFREGGRAVLTTPPTCGTHTTDAAFVPWSAEDPENPKPSEVLHTTSSFQVTQGPGGGPCPSGGVPPFKPGFQAGSLNNNAGSFSRFDMRLIRNDGEQDMTKFSAVLPKGVVARIAGTSKCSDQAITAAKQKTGRAELSSPSCPPSSQIGRILAGAGVGSVLTHVPGKLYLAGPFAGAPLSVVAITAAVAGPFDVGVVVNRQALTLNPRTGQVNVDGDKSDPIPHILAGIPLKVRDVRIYVDKPNFTINPTSCNRFEVLGKLWGSFLDPLNSADDVPVDVSTPYQAANCLNLGFKPRLSLRLKGGTKRGGHPGLKAVLRTRSGDANVAGAQVTLPHSAFLEQSHIRTVCTRVQFAGDSCPKGSIYGYAKAITPLLDEPLEGPVYLRSSNHKLPDLVAALSGFVEIELVGRIDSVKGGIRTTFAGVPDAPTTRFVLTMQGGRKGLIVNSRNLCASTNRAKARFEGQNGKEHSFRPVVKAPCAKGLGNKSR